MVEIPQAVLALMVAAIVGLAAWLYFQRSLLLADLEYEKARYQDAVENRTSALKVARALCDRQTKLAAKWHEKAEAAIEAQQAAESQVADLTADLGAMREQSDEAVAAGNEFHKFTITQIAKLTAEHRAIAAHFEATRAKVDANLRSLVQSLEWARNILNMPPEHLDKLWEDPNLPKPDDKPADQTVIRGVHRQPPTDLLAVSTDPRVGGLH